MVNCIIEGSLYSNHLPFQVRFRISRNVHFPNYFQAVLLGHVAMSLGAVTTNIWFWRTQYSKIYFHTNLKSIIFLSILFNIQLWPFLRFVFILNTGKEPQTDNTTLSRGWAVVTQKFPRLSILSC